MLFHIPYSVKNPLKHFPYATVTIIGLNFVVFAFTSHSFLVIREEIVVRYALRWGVSPLYTLFTGTFLHGDTMHLLSNMFFLWVFGPAVEDRLRIPMYVLLYTLTGVAANVAEATLGVLGDSPVACLGASGCVMGVLGAYWYLYSWSPVRVFNIPWLILKFLFGLRDISAAWLIGGYFVLNLVNGLLARSSDTIDGVAHFAHVGGALTGAVIVWALKIKRDSRDISAVKAVWDETRDIERLTIDMIKMLLEDSPDDEKLLIGLARKARQYDDQEAFRYAIRINPRLIIIKHPELALHYLILMQGPPDEFSMSDLINLGRWCEKKCMPDQALHIYGIVETKYSGAPELELVLYRMAFIYWHFRRSVERAYATLEKLLSTYPAGQMTLEAENLRDEIRRRFARAA